MFTSKFTIFSVFIGLSLFAINVYAEYYVVYEQPEPYLIWIYSTPQKSALKKLKRSNIVREVYYKKVIVPDDNCCTDQCEAAWRARQPLVFYTNPPVYSESYMVYGNDDVNYDTGTADHDW